MTGSWPSNHSAKKSLSAGVALAWSLGESRWLMRSVPRSESRTIGAVRCPGFGDPAARVLLVGLAPAAHGGNRTGRVFTGDRSGDWLFAAPWRTGFANQPESVAIDDGLLLSDAYVVAALRRAPPANKPTPSERDACLPYLNRELSLLTDVRVIVALGQFAHQIVAGELEIRPRPRFGHGAEALAPGGIVLLSSYHPSQRNHRGNGENHGPASRGWRLGFAGREADVHADAVAASTAWATLPTWVISTLRGLAFSAMGMVIVSTPSW